MTNRLFICVLVYWCLFTFTSYYYTDNFYVLLSCLGLLFLFGVFTLFRIVLMFQQWKTISRESKIRVGVVVLLCALSLYPVYTFWVIEKADWYLLRDERKEIVEEFNQVRGSTTGDLKGLMLTAPFHFPPVSFGDKIRVHRNQEKGTMTVKFWISQGFLDSPSEWFVYTNDPEQVRVIEEQVRQRPWANWKIEENWYRYCGHF